MFLLWGMLFSIVWPKRTFSEQENRSLAQRPGFSIQSILSGEYGSAYESYLSDQFFLRDQWLKLEAASERFFGKKDVNGVYFARDHYLIERHRREEIEAERLEKNIQAVARFLSEYPGNFLAVPSASYILKDKLPAFGQESEFSQEDALNRIEEVFQEKGMADCFYRADSVLSLHKGEEIYYHTDHHWTTLGAYYSYVFWAQRRGLIPVSYTEERIKTVSRNFYGTVFSKVGIGGKADEIQIYMPEGNFSVDYNLGQRITDSFYEWSYLKKKDQYALFFDGNQPIVRITSENKNGKRLLVIKDSYDHCFIPFLEGDYEEIIMVDLRYYHGSI